MKRFQVRIRPNDMLRGGSAQFDDLVARLKATESDKHRLTAAPTMSLAVALDSSTADRDFTLILEEGNRKMPWLRLLMKSAAFPSSLARDLADEFPEVFFGWDEEVSIFNHEPMVYPHPDLMRK